MAGVPSDYSLIGEVLAISLAIILISGLALYVAFRVRATLHEERGRGARVAKVAFLIGLLFLSGGVFYFFASGFNSQGGAPGSSTSSTPSTISASTTSVTSTPSSTSSITTSTGGSTSSSTTGVTTTVVTTTVVSTTSSPTSSTTSSTRSSTSTTTSSISTTSTTSSTPTTTTSTSSAQGSLSMTLSFPSTETKGSNFYGTFTIINNGSATASSVTLQVGNLFNQFTFQSCTESVSGGIPQDCKSSVNGNVISVGNVPSGTTVFSLGLQAPSQPGQLSDTVTLYFFLGSQRSLTTTLTIHITA